MLNKNYLNKGGIKVPTLKNVFTNPEVNIVFDELIGDGERKAVVEVTGLMCYSLWVDRVTKALEGLSEVTNVNFLPKKDHFVVHYDSFQSLTDKFQEVVLKTVVAPGVRKTLGAVGAK